MTRRMHTPPPQEPGLAVLFAIGLAIVAAGATAAALTQGKALWVLVNGGRWE